MRTLARSALGPVITSSFRGGVTLRQTNKTKARLARCDQDPEQPGQRARAASKDGTPEQACMYRDSKHARIGGAAAGLC